MTGNEVIIDTNVVVRHFRNAGSINDRLIAHEVILPQIALGELYAGAHKSARAEHHCRVIETFLPSVTLLSGNKETALYYGQVWAELVSIGQIIPQNDIWIAALAIQYGIPLVSYDAHFERVANIELIRW